MTLPPQAIGAGQISFTTPGTHKWTCPEGVTRVCLAMMGSGGRGVAGSSSTTRYYGAGGNLRYINDVEVVPGQEYEIVVANGSTTRFSLHSQALGYSTASVLDETVKGADGQASSYTGSGSTTGGNAGGVTTSKSGYGFSLTTFLQVGRPTGSSFPGGIPGGGGGVNTSASPNYGLGGRGEVRIIWGEDRAFPDKNIGDM